MKHTPVKRHEHDLPPNRTNLEVMALCCVTTGHYHCITAIQLDPTGGPKDMFGQPPNVLDVGPALFAQPRPSQVKRYIIVFIIIVIVLIGNYWAQGREGSSD